MNYPIGRLPKFFLVLTSVFALLHSSSSSAENLKVQAGLLEEHGGFQVRHEKGIETLIAVGSAIAPAVGAINLPHAGQWHLWVQSLSMPLDGPNERNFSVRLGSRRVEKIFGAHHGSFKRDFVWEDGGSIDLAQGQLLLVIGELNTAKAQCGEIMLSDDSGKASPEELSKAATAAKSVALTRSNKLRTGEMPSVKLTGTTVAASMANDLVRISFLQGVAGSGSAEPQAALVQHIEVRSGDSWVSLPTTGGADSYRAVYRPEKSNPRLVDAYTQFPAWDTSFAPAVTLSAGGATMESHEGPTTAPWLAGQLFRMRPVGARQIDPQTVELQFAPLSIGTLTARWHLLPGQPSASVELSFALNAPGYLSLGYHGAVEDSVGNLDFLMLPYLYLGHRFPVEAVTMPSDDTPTPAAMITRQGVSYAVMAEPGIIPFVWPGIQEARYVLGIRNESGKAEPLLYEPLLGSEQSLHKSPEKTTAQFRVWMQKAGWTEAYRNIVTQTYGLRDYRKPVTASLSDTILNLYGLMKNDDASGWNARAKGSWNIESRNTVTQPGPLTYLSYALLTGDADFYKRYALPSLEFILSRPEPHFSAAEGAGEDSDAGLPLGGPIGMYTAGFYASAYRMTQGGTPAFMALCFNQDKSINTRPSHYSIFDDQLALYQVTGDKHWLVQAVDSADRYIAENIVKLPTRDLGQEPFVNVSFTPDWEGLLHLYEVTHEPRFLKASRDTAYWLMSSIWTQPSIPAGDITVHPEGTYADRPHIWWKGDHRFRLGFYDEPAAATEHEVQASIISVPTAKVPSWQVSNVGLGIEQPVTYVQSKSDNNILMSAWAPNLLRLYELTGDTLFRTYARNATIGRFANYPGYYLNLFTNVYESPEYPLKGPDLTFFYYHHIAPFAAYVQDYVFSDAEVRSKGQFAFPSARQFGYVWFDSRLRGFAPGKVYGETAWPWIHRTAAISDNKNVDIVLAHGEGTLYFALMNQSDSPQHVVVQLDPKVLGAEVNGKNARLWVDNSKAPAQRVRSGTLSFDLPTGGFTVAAVDGLHIDVPAHHLASFATFPSQPDTALETQGIAKSELKTTGTYIVTPQFKERELYVYVHANEKQCMGATLAYRIGNGEEKKSSVKQFPCEFSIPLPFDAVPVHWHVEDVKNIAAQP